MAGMHNFVKNKNPDGTKQGTVPGGNQVWDDLYAQPTKTTTAPNSHQLRSKSQQANQNAPIKGEPEAHNAQRPTRRASNGEKRFYDTDASSIEGTSTATSAPRSHLAVPQAHQQRHSANGAYDEQDRLSSSGSEESGSTEPEEDRDLPADPLAVATSELNQKQWAIVEKVEAQKKKQPDGTKLPYVKGDTYPSTTSCRPSESDVDHHIDTRPVAQVHISQATSHVALPNRESSHRQPLGQVSTKQHGQAYQPADATHAMQHSATSGHLVRQDDGTHAPIEQRVASSFSFGKPAKQPLSVRPSPQGRQKIAPEAARSSTVASNNTAHRATAPTNGESSTHFPPQQRSIEDTNANVVPSQPPHGSKSQSKNYHAPLLQQRVVETAPEYEQLSDAKADMQGGFAAHTKTDPQSKEHEMQLDYEASDLFKMEYYDLKCQPFDVDPNAGDFKLPVEQQDDSLETKLDTVRALQPEDQSHFFSSLSLDEWEQAGEWFLGRFSSVVGMLKDARQEKRKAAKLFEDEIESRFKAVGKKRKQIEESFVEMKESGGKVLQGTPKKTKTR